MALMSSVPTRRFDVKVDTIETTRGPTINHPGDYIRSFVSGRRHYFVDDVEVSEDEFRASFDAHQGDKGAQLGTELEDRVAAIIHRELLDEGGEMLSVAAEMAARALIRAGLIRD